VQAEDGEPVEQGSYIGSLSSRWSDQLRTEIRQRPRSKMQSTREIESYIGGVAGGLEVQIVAEDSSSGLAG